MLFTKLPPCMYGTQLSFDLLRFDQSVNLLKGLSGVAPTLCVPDFTARFWTSFTSSYSGTTVAARG